MLPKMIPINKLVLPPFNIRETSGGEGKFADSISTFGLQSALKVRPNGDGYEVICGRERYLSAIKAGVDELPCLVQEMTDLQAMEAMFVENFERLSLSDYEVGRWFSLLLKQFPEQYPTKRSVADKFKISESYVSMLISHYEFCNKYGNASKLNESVTREIRRLPEPLQKQMLEKVAGAEEDKWSVKEVKAEVEKLLGNLEKPEPPPIEELLETKKEEQITEEALQIEEDVEGESFDELVDELKGGIKKEAEDLSKKITNKREKLLSDLEVYYPFSMLDFVLKHNSGDINDLSTEKLRKMMVEFLDVVWEEIPEEIRNRCWQRFETESLKWL